MFVIGEVADRHIQNSHQSNTSSTCHSIRIGHCILGSQGDGFFAIGSLVLEAEHNPVDAICSGTRCSINNCANVVDSTGFDNELVRDAVAQ